MKFKTLKKKVWDFLFKTDHATAYYSQGGEDAILRAIFNGKLKKGEHGFFVDVGAFHPYSHSNTYFFYLRKWRGINIDARPGSMFLFEKWRNEDINLEIGVGEEENDAIFYIIDENSPRNSFSQDNLQKQRVMDWVKKEVQVPMTTLKAILEEHSTSFTQIDLLTIDVEGYDFEVLKSNDWDKFIPNVIVVELECTTIDELMSNQSSQFLMQKGYRIIAKNVIVKDVASVFFVHENYDY